MDLPEIKWLYPRTKGFSVRSLVRFCGIKSIQKTSRLSAREVDIVVSGAVAKVSKYGLCGSMWQHCSASAACIWWPRFDSSPWLIFSFFPWNSSKAMHAIFNWKHTRQTLILIPHPIQYTSLACKSDGQQLLHGHHPPVSQQQFSCPDS